ncbi:DUF72 domain-containing protein [Aquisalinus flavus]|uniref:DUF72 domain-containing protein n=1 Tax=Aquisalinus flavus TaxID=1526572 RepID=A0A8J2V4U7_9PROT|nr:DUF72 domain-containing protein [Aquisalinus flavus]MBD0425781.1 DUF72 domain-containing protein [Aquisalinus flavus]UNE48612.1 DUF72 domain-containing protein [Aquisalinus flavus]GGD13361.1 hypothetical protein GCM10011342_22620 [Aquisalinus flavus]
MAKSGDIRIGIGGWTFAPWRGVFYPDELKQKDELSYAAGKLSTIEINGTFYRAQKPATYAGWAESVPDGFVFSLKAPRYATNRKDLREAGESIERFTTGGIAEMGDRLGPILWQLAETKTFEPEEIDAYLAMLPAKAGGIELRHALEVRHASFCTPEMIALARKHDVAIVRASDSRFPEIADVTADFVYLRCMGTTEKQKLGLSKKALDDRAAQLKALAAGKADDKAELLAKPMKTAPRDVFCYVISGHKALNPLAAMALIDRLG